MGLEDLVNLLLKPVEGVAQVVYDLCFATGIKREVVGDGKVSYKVIYMNDNPLKKYFDFVEGAYHTGKKFIQEKVVRKIDQGAVFLEKYVNEYITKPIIEFYQKNKFISYCALGLGLYYLI